MKRKLLAVLIGCGLGLVCADLAAALEIIYPSNGVYVTRSDFLIVKGGDKPTLDGMTVAINGVNSDLIDIASPDYRAAFADFLILQPEWDQGKNTITIEGYAGGAVVAKATADIYFLGGDPSTLPPRDYKPFVMHTPEKEALCLPCHVMNPDKVQLSAESADKNPCASCHKRLLDAPYVHGPAGVYQCIACHDPASKPQRYQLKASPVKLCAECHFDKVEEYNKNAFVHGPVATGLCLLCHDPHASAQPGQLLAPVNTICLGCHSTLLGSNIHVVRGVSGKGHPLARPNDPSNPGKPFTCASCHNPHGGAVQPLFQRGISNRFELCRLCHVK